MLHLSTNTDGIMASKGEFGFVVDFKRLGESY